MAVVTQTILPIPLTFLTLFVLVYYIRRRYKLYKEIKRIPNELLSMQSYQNHRKNLKLHCIINNFVILLLLIELIQNIFDLNFIFSSCIYTLGLKLNSLSVFITKVARFDNIIFCTLNTSLVPVLSLLMDFLWLAYRKYEYKNTLIRWSVYILLRVFVITTISYFTVVGFPWHDYYSLFVFVFIIVFGFVYIFDFIQYSHFARKFYLHLKSREKEIRLFYFDKKAYLDSRFLRIHFQIATSLVTITLFFFTFAFCLDAWLTTLTAEFPFDNSQRFNNVLGK